MGCQLYRSGKVPLPPSEATGESYKLWADAVTDELNSLSQSVFDVRDFGARGDGVTDDTDAIQHAIDSAGTIIGPNSSRTYASAPIFFPSAISFYRTTAPLAITDDFAVLRGATPGVTIKNTTSGSDVLSINSNVAAQVQAPTVESLTLLGTGTSSRAIYANLVAHLRISAVNCIDHPGTALYMESIDTTVFTGCVFAHVSDLLVQSSSAVSGIVDIGGIKNRYESSRVRECETGVWFKNTNGNVLDDVYIEANNRGTLKTGIRIEADDFSDNDTLRLLRHTSINNCYFEDNANYAVHSDGYHYINIANPSLIGSVDISSGVTPTNQVALHGGGTICGIQEGGGTRVVSDSGKVVITDSANFYGRADQLIVRGSMPPFVGCAVNAATGSWFDVDPSWAGGGTSAPNIVHQTSGGFLGTNSEDVGFPTGGAGFAYSRHNMVNALISATSGDVLTGIVLFKSSAANEDFILRYLDNGSRGHVVRMPTSTDWQVAVLRTVASADGNALPYGYMGQAPSSVLTVTYGGVGVAQNDIVSLVNTGQKSLSSAGVAFQDIHISGTPNIINTSVPGSGTASGSTGDHAWDTSYVYICTSTDSWRRATLNTF
jgi:hypothetical protein